MAVVEAAAPVPAKVILETHYLNEEQICRVCDIAVEVGMKWVKTSTGWAPTGATPEKVSIIAGQLKVASTSKARGIRESGYRARALPARRPPLRHESGGGDHRTGPTGTKSGPLP